MAAICPECDNPILVEADEVEEGQSIECDECGAELEVVSIDPIEVTAIETGGYDEEDDLRHSSEDDE